MELYCSYNWLKKLTNTKKSPEEVARLLSEFGPTVDRTADWGVRFENMVVGVIDDVQPHPDAEKLRLVKTDIGEKQVQVVCGGSNLEVGQKVVVTLPGSKVRWHGEGELVELSETKIRGEKSFGMICGASEIGLEKWFPLHDEREIMDVRMLDCKAGTPLAEALGIDDVVFEIEVTSNRVDLMSMEGIARELMAIEGRTFEVPETKKIDGGSEVLKVEVLDEELCSRYQAVKIDGVRVGPSPLWMQSALYKAGFKPINNLVDISNYVMLEQGQPMHAFDGEKVEKIVVRRAKNKEVFVALDDVEYELDDSMLVIADAHNAVAVAGVMGGKDSGINEYTNSVVWEAANFNKVNIRKTARKLLLFSESQSRFDKGLSPFATQRALERAVFLTLELAGGEVVSEVVDVKKSEYKPLEYDFKPDDIARIAGFEISINDAQSSLERLGFEISGKQKWNITVPYWRDGDIEEGRDCIEEIVRLYGYMRVAGTIPEGVSTVLPDPVFAAGERIANYLEGKGFSEMISYSMIGTDDIAKLGDDVDEYVHIANPLSTDAEYLRVSMLSGVLHAVKRNESHAGSGALFEIGNLYTKQEGDLPIEERYVMCVMWDIKPSSPLFFRMKGVLGGLIDVASATAAFDNLHPGRSALLMHGECEVGVMGEVHPHTLKQFDVDSKVVICQLKMDELVKIFGEGVSFVVLPEFPGVKRDIAFFIDEKVLYEEIEGEILDAHHLIHKIELFDVYQGKGVPEGKKSLAFHIEYVDPAKTLSMEEADEAHLAVEKVLSKLGGEVRK